MNIAESRLILPDQSLLIELLAYDSLTGIFTWNRRDRKYFSKDRIWGTWNTRFARTPAGRLRTDGYIGIQVLGHRYLAHRLAWKMMTGDDPPEEIDHIDGNPRNNTWCNLRAATRTQNMCNRPAQKSQKRPKTSKYKGVSYIRPDCWRARINSDKVHNHLGHFKTEEEAYAARCKASAVFQKEFENLEPRKWLSS